MEQPDGTWGFRGEKGQLFDAIVKNTLDAPTVIHWHGLILPNNQDGVPYVTQPPIPAKGSYHYRFKLVQAGTYWMHSHADLQEQRFLSAPFIINDPNEHIADKEVVMMIGDFSFKEPTVILKDLRKSNRMPMNMSQGKMSMSSSMLKNSKSSQPDLVDVHYDAFLTNYRTLQNPEIIPVKEGEKVRLRIIAGSAMTNFFIHTGQLNAEAIAVDGERIKPILGNQFQLAVGQRIDLLVTIPKGEGTYPILAQGEGTNMRTGLILATENAKIVLPNEKIATKAGALNYDQEFKTTALHPLSPQKPGQTLTVTLDGSMATYTWQINKQSWPIVNPIEVKPNKRIEMVFVNNTGMEHPMHLHGHVFEVTEIDGKPLKQGAMRDTVLVMPKSTVKIQFDTNNPGNWMMHCHMLYHQATGMMTFINYDGVDVPSLKGLQEGGSGQKMN
ncbi:multicopper oxidase family protein [Legionella waltersii]|uniref:multicopper oxidase family protein n=1 Tax=Legionella waltersii TaxID=66969 RepID=UPI002F90E37E